MYSQRALQEYTATSVQTGSPVRLVAMLYEGAMRFLREAEDAIDRRDFPAKADRINRAMRIVQELGNALEDDAAPDLAAQLHALYEFCEHEMLQASTFNDARHLRNASRILERLHTAWEQLADRGVSADDASGVEAPDVPPSAIESTTVAPPSAPAAPTPWVSHDEARDDRSAPSLSLSA